MENAFEVILTISVLSLWFIFPLGLFLSVSHVDRKGEQSIHLNDVTHVPTAEKVPVRSKPSIRPHMNNLVKH